MLGRKVQLKIVDDASSPDQVVTNYQNLITQDKVDLVFGPFSSLLTVPASRVASRYHYASSSRPAADRPCSRRSSQPLLRAAGAHDEGGRRFANYILSLPASERPKTAAYAKLDDPFSAPIADNIKTRFEAAGIKTVYDQTYPSETADMTPIIAGIAATKPGRRRRRHPERGRLRPGQGDGPAEVQPEVPVRVERRELPGDFPDKVGCANTSGMFSSADWYPDSTVAGSKQFICRVHRQVRRDGQQDRPDISARPTRPGCCCEEVAKKTGKIDNATIISTLHSGTWPTLRRRPEVEPVRRTAGRLRARPMDDGKLHHGVPGRRARRHTPIAPKPNWVG